MKRHSFILISSWKLPPSRVLCAIKTRVKSIKAKAKSEQRQPSMLYIRHFSYQKRNKSLLIWVAGELAMHKTSIYIESKVSSVLKYDINTTSRDGVSGIYVYSFRFDSPIFMHHDPSAESAIKRQQQLEKKVMWASKQHIDGLQLATNDRSLSQNS